METLAERIAREGPVNELDAVGWIVRLAKKLEMLHSRGLSHGGISPEALKTASASRLSLGMLVPLGAVRNRLEFRSPERLEADVTSEADDTWSAAATLYALLTGSSPFVANDDEAIRQKIRAGTFAPLSSFDVGDDDLQHVIEAALNPSFATRTKTMAAFREALEGWHPDQKVRELPPMVDDQPDDEDDDERTQMRPVSAADAVRALMVQREQAAAAAGRAPLPSQPSAPEPAAKPAPPVAQPPPVARPAARAAQPPPVARPAAPAPQPPPVAHGHGLLEDDDDEKTSVISVPAMALMKSRGIAVTPTPPPGDAKSTPPPASAPQTGFGMMRAPASQPPRRSLAKQTVVGGFAAVRPPVETPAPGAVPPPVPPRATSPSAISREAVIEEGDNEATVMREAPADVLRKAKASVAPPALDRATPVDPTSAAVAATTAGSDAPPAAGTSQPAAAQAGASDDATASMFGAFTDTDKEVEPRETPVSPQRGVNVKSLLADVPKPPAAPPAEARPPLASTPSATAPAAPALASLTAPSTPGMAAHPPPTATPTAVSRQSVAAMASNQPAAPQAAPIVPTTPPQSSALKGLFIGVGLALLILAAAAAVYFVIKY